MTDYAKENGLETSTSKNENTRRNLIGSKEKPGKYIADLIAANLIETHENGWIVIDPGTSSGMMLKKDR